MDRRVVRTRRALQHAFLKLVAEKGYDAVSIQDICKAADVGRSTFYLHFTGKEHLKRSGLEHLRRELEAHRQRQADANVSCEALEFSRPMFEHAKDHLHIYRALAGSSGGGVALSTIRDILTDQLRKDLSITQVTSTVEREFRLQFLLGAFMSVLTWWLDAGAKGDPAEIDQAFKALALPGLSQAKPISLPSRPGSA
jgi:AcrR family transcriptional regulator